MEFRFKQENRDVEARKRNCEKIRNQFPDKIPIICEKDPKARTLRDIDKTKYLVPNDLTVSQFNFMIRKRIEINKEETFFLLANGKTALSGDANLLEMYEKYKDKDDGFLYIAYSSELTWGNN